MVLVCLVLGFDAGEAVDAASAEPVAGAFEGEDVGMVDDPVDHGGHRYRPIASFTHRATLRLSTSRSIASSAFSRRSRASSACSSSLSAPLPAPRRRLSAFTQLPKMPALIPRSRDTCAIG